MKSISYSGKPEKIEFPLGGIGTGCVSLARYVHFDVRASRRSRKQIQPISSEKIRNLPRPLQVHKFGGTYPLFPGNPREMGLFRNQASPSSQP